MVKLVFALGILAVAMSPARAESDSETLTAFGILGTWAVDCHRPASSSNPHIAYRAGAGGQPTYEYRANAVQADFTAELREVRILAADRVAFIEPVRGAEFRVTLMRLADGRIRLLESLESDGKPIIRDGVILRSGQPAAALEKCGQELG